MSTLSTHRLERLDVARPMSLKTGLFVVMIVTFLVHLGIRSVTDPKPFGDELRYLSQATALANGDSMYPDGSVKNPPLYPALLAVLVRVGVPTENLAYLNIAMMALASATFFVLLCRFLARRHALLLTIAFALYPPHLMLGSRMMVEPLAILVILLICRALYAVGRDKVPTVGRIVCTAGLLALLALTKPVFAYAFVVAIVLGALLALLVRPAMRTLLLRLSAMFVLALVLCAPYLAYTAKLTGKSFSWVTSDAVHVYWMTVGGEDVWGNWIAIDVARRQPELVDAGHVEVLEQVKGLDAAESKRFLGDIVKQRIREQPMVYLRNVIANTGRLLFNYPFSFRPQSLGTYGYILPNMMLYLALAIAAALLPRTYKHQNIGLLAVVAVALLYLGGNLPIASAARQGIVVVGPFLVWIAYQAHLAVRIGLINPHAR